MAENPLLQPPGKENLENKIKGLLNSSSSGFSYNQPSFIKNSGELIENTENQKQEHASLQEYLFHQLRMTFLNECELSIAQELIKHIDTNGYLSINLEDFAKKLNFSLDKIENVLKTIQNLEPSGVGAKDLQECLLIQLNNEGKTESLVFQVVNRCFKELTKKKYGLIAKKLKITELEAQSAIKEIRLLNPKPGACFSQGIAIRVTPDIIIDKKKNGVEITINQETFPRLEINDCYQEILRDIETPVETKQFIKKHLRDAQWLIKAVNQRNQNILKVVREIAKIQKRALFQDISAVRPLTLKDIAQKTGLHLSTVGRIVKNKYVSTPQGTIKLKDLFSIKYDSKNGASISGKNIAAKIKNITVSSTNPLTDQKIADMLQKEGICISRRTVAKYRNKLRIPPSFFR